MNRSTNIGVYWCTCSLEIFKKKFFFLKSWARKSTSLKKGIDHCQNRTDETIQTIQIVFDQQRGYGCTSGLLLFQYFFWRGRSYHVSYKNYQPAFPPMYMYSVDSLSHILKSWYTCEGPEQGFWHYFADGLNQRFSFL